MDGESYTKPITLEQPDPIRKKRQLPPTPNVLLHIYNHTATAEVPSTIPNHLNSLLIKQSLTSPRQMPPNSIKYIASANIKNKPGQPFAIPTISHIGNNNHGPISTFISDIKLPSTAISDKPLIEDQVNPSQPKRTIPNNNSLYTNLNLSTMVAKGPRMPNGKLCHSSDTYGFNENQTNLSKGQRRTVKRYLPSLAAAMQSGAEASRDFGSKGLEISHDTDSKTDSHSSVKGENVVAKNSIAVVNKANKKVPNLSLRENVPQTREELKSNPPLSPLVPSSSHDKIFIKRRNVPLNRDNKTKSESDVCYYLQNTNPPPKDPIKGADITLSMKRELLRRSKTIKGTEKELIPTSCDVHNLPPLYLRSDEKTVDNRQNANLYQLGSYSPFPYTKAAITQSTVPQLIDTIAKLKIAKKDYIRKSFRREKLYQRRRSSLNDLEIDSPNGGLVHPSYHILPCTIPENAEMTGDAFALLKNDGSKDRPTLLKSQRLYHTGAYKSFSDSNESLQILLNGRKNVKPSLNTKLLSNLRSKISGGTFHNSSDKAKGSDVGDGSIEDGLISPKLSPSLSVKIAKPTNTKVIAFPRMAIEDQLSSPTSQLRDELTFQRQTDLGEIKFSVWYMADIKELRVEIIRAENLVRPESRFSLIRNLKVAQHSHTLDGDDGSTIEKTILPVSPGAVSCKSGKGISSGQGLKPNPYLEISFIHEGGKTTQESVDPKKYLGQSDPEFHEIFKFDSVEVDDLETSQLQIKVLHKSSSSIKRNELMGEVRLDLNAKDFLTEKRMWRELLPKIKKEVNGYLKIALRIDFKLKKMTVTVIQAKDLPKHLLTGPPDTFVTICLVENGVPSLGQNKRTKEKRKTSEPVYKEAFSLFFEGSTDISPTSYEKFSGQGYNDPKPKQKGQSDMSLAAPSPLSPYQSGSISPSGFEFKSCHQSSLPTKTSKRESELAKTGLWFTVYNSTLLNKRMIGQVRLGYGSTETSEISQWREAIQKPGLDITKWHYLMEA